MAQYSPHTWVDDEIGGTPITAAKLTDIENALVDGDMQNPASTAYGLLGAKADTTALAPALVPTLKLRGAWAAGTDYVLNDVVTSGAAVFYCTIAHTAANPAPSGTGNAYWAPLGVPIGTAAGTAADAAATQAKFDGLPQTVLWDTVNNAWPTPNPNAIAVTFDSLSTATENVTAPPYFNDASTWLRRVKVS